ncbi:type 2 lantibiotic [Streptococcus pneumoniae]|nr:type 2 lantibiotic [Streptococcus pneumoniae]
MKNDFVIGKSLKELSLEEMQLVYGGTDGADPRSTIRLVRNLVHFIIDDGTN